MLRYNYFYLIIFIYSILFFTYSCVNTKPNHQVSINQKQENIDDIIEDLTYLNNNTYSYKEALIICLHDIGDNAKGKYSITTKQFIQILDILKDKYEVLSIRDWQNKNISQKNKNTKPIVVLTFDDGYASLLTIVTPLLIQYNYGATFLYIFKYV